MMSLGTRNVFRSVKSLCISYIETDILHMGILQIVLCLLLSYDVFRDHKKWVDSNFGNNRRFEQFIVTDSNVLTPAAIQAVTTKQNVSLRWFKLSMKFLGMMWW